MFLFFCRRFLSAIPTLFICTLLIFFIIRLIPGDPVDHLLGERGVHPELKQELMEKWGLDLPWYQQYFIFISQAVRGDLGRSLISGRPVWEEFRKSLSPLQWSFLFLLCCLLCLWVSLWDF